MAYGFLPPMFIGGMGPSPIVLSKAKYLLFSRDCDRGDGDLRCGRIVHRNDLAIARNNVLRFRVGADDQSGDAFAELRERRQWPPAAIADNLCLAAKIERKQNGR